jgi:hypothetical protein
VVMLVFLGCSFPLFTFNSQFTLGALLCFPPLVLVHLLLTPALVDLTYLHGCCHAVTIVLIVIAIIVACAVIYVLAKRIRKWSDERDVGPARTESATEVPTSPKKADYQTSGASNTVAPQSDYGTGINGGTSAPATNAGTQPQVSPYALYQPGTQAASPPQFGSAAPPPAFPYGNAVNSNQAPQHNLPSV